MATTDVYPNCTPCCTPPIVTACCPGGTPTTLYATFDSSTGTCACFDGVTVPLVYNTLSWQGVQTFCGGSQTISLICNGTDWSISALTSCVFGAIQPSYTCTPTSIVFTGVSVTGCCTGTVRITITETPP